MKLEVNKEADRYHLTIDGEKVFDSIMLSDIVRKIEAYLKLRYIPEQQKKSFLQRLSGVVNGS